MPLLRTLAAGFVCLSCLSGQSTTPDVGSGAPNSAITQFFLQAFFRNGFPYLVSLPPINNVQKLGTSGYVQEFYDVNKTAGVKYALIDPNSSTAFSNGQTPVFQVYPPMYAYYQSVGSAVAGYPASDTLSCPPLPAGNSCTYQLFDKPSILFVYSAALPSGGTTFSILSPFYAIWTGLGGMSGLGPAASAQVAYTSPAGNVATVQAYNSGFIADITSGTLTPRTISVKEPVFDLYIASGGYTGTLGLPIGPEILQSNGHRRQSFEGGTIDYNPAVNGSAAILLPVATVQVIPQPPGGTLRLNQGDTATLTASAAGADGGLLTGRTFTWSTTNGRIVSVSPGSGAATTAVIKAVAGGVANISVSSEGVTSAPLSVFVTAPCCGVGEGAPTIALQQAFQDAITRNQLNPVLPAATPVVQIGVGFVQQLQSASTGEPFWLAASQSTGNAYLIHGLLLAEYQNEGGPAGKLGFPLSDPTPAGRQNFQGGTLAGNPVQLVTGAILAKWALLGYETGAAGSPAGAATPFLSFRATAGTTQAFQNAMIFALASGALSGKTFWISGPVLAAYLNAPDTLGSPTNDEIGLNGIRHQDFEGGYAEYNPGDSIAQVTPLPRVPSVSANPASAPAGAIVRLSAGGFNPNAQLRVSVTGQPDFLVTAPSGAYVWESYVPLNARSSTITVAAIDTQTQATAQAAYSIRAGSQARLTLKVTGGDSQTGFPGANLPIPVKVVLSDDAGIAIPNSPVSFTPSPGGSISQASGFTDENGEATAVWRLPLQSGVALLSVSSSGYLASLSARAGGSVLPNFPALQQTAASGALLTSAAAAIRYFQARGGMGSANGLADPATLKTYLQAACTVDQTGAPLCDGFLQPGAGASDPVANLWRLRGFVSGLLDVRTIPPAEAPVRDALAQGTPVILALSMTLNGAPSGSHFVVATGLDNGGNLTIMDPNPAFAQSSLYGYQNGFTTRSGASYSGALTGAAVISPKTPVNPGFLVAVNALTTIQSPAGACGAPFVFPSGQGQFNLHYCDAVAAPLYELDMDPSSGDFQGSVTDLATPGARADLTGGGGAAFAIDHTSTPQWQVEPLAVQFQPADVVNAASPAQGLAPGILASISGSGLAPAGSIPSVAVNGTPALVVNATPFRVDFQIPPDSPPGPAVLDVANDLTGSAEQSINLNSAAPALLAGSVTNPDGSPNSRYLPASRGQSITVTGTGFSTLSSLTAAIGGVPVAVSGLAALPDSPGLSQITIALPLSLPPGLALDLLVIQTDPSSGNPAQSNPVPVAIQ